MSALIETGISNQQLLAVWSTNANIGFTSAQLLTAGITVAQMQSNDITLAQIHAGGVTPAQLLAAGITSAEMLAAEITVAQMQASGITLEQIHAGGVTPAQLLAAGITSAEMLAAEITVAQMQASGITLGQIHAGGVSIAHLLGTGMSITQLRTGGVPDYALFNEACNTPLSVGTSPGPTIKLLSTNLRATNTQVVLEGRASGTAIWNILGKTNFASIGSGSGTTPRMLGRATAILIGVEGTIVSTLSLPFDYVFSNLTVRLTDDQARITNFQLCPGR